MQNWNQWQVPAGTVTAPMPPTPAGFTAPGADPMAMMQSYMQYYNQPAPSGYTAEQWASAQQQNWTQWQQWQQQFQQWQAQYGEKYQETMKQLSAQGLSLPNIAQAPPLPSSQPPPPLPKEDSAKPPLPPDSNNPYQYSNMPPPNQNNLPLFPSKSQSGDSNRGGFNYAQPPLPPGQPPLPASNPQEPPSANLLGEKRGNNEPVNSGSAKKNKVQSEELTEAEKTFDAQFKQWEEQFNKWKQQNANHPDKTQYKQYEAKWTSWREKLIERREQMRKKREQQKQSAKLENEKTKSMSGGDKILNLLSSSENQGLLNNLLGIGKTLGLTGKQDADKASTSSANSTVVAPLPPTQPAPSLQPAAMAAPAMTTDMNQAAWAAQQWAAQYNVTMGLQNYGAFPMVPGMAPAVAAMPPPLAAMAPPAVAAPFPQQSGNHYSQPPPSLPNSGINFSQPPPGFGGSDSRQMPGPGIKQNQQNAPPPLFGSDGDKRDGSSGNDQFSQGNDRFQSSDNRLDRDNDQRFGSNDRGDSANQFSSGNYRFGQDAEFGGGNRGGGNQFGSENDRFNQDADRFGGNRQRDFGSNERGGSGNQFRENDSFAPRNDRFRQENDRFGSSDDGDAGTKRFSRDNDSFAPSNDRFGSSDRAALGSNRLGRNLGSFGSGNDRFGSSNDRLGSDIDRFSSSTDRFGSNSANDQFGLGSKDRFGAGSDRFGTNNDRLSLGNDRFDSGNSHFGSGSGKDNFNKSHGFNDSFGSGTDRFNRSDRSDISDHFDSKDPNYVNDNRHDSFGDNSRGLNRNTRPFESSDSIAPELKKLMEKRRAAMNVFKPRDDTFNPVKQDNIGSLSESFKKITGELPYAGRNPGDAGPKSLLGLGPRGPDSSMSRGSGDFAPRGSDNLMSRGPGDFGPRGLDNFMSRGPGDFGPRGSDNPMSRGTGDFGPRGSDNAMSRGPGDFGPRGSDNAMSRGPGDFGSRGSDNPKSRGPGDFGPRGSDNPMSRGPGDFGPRGSDNPMSRGPGEFGSRGPGAVYGNNNLNQQAPRGMEFGSFPPPGPLGPPGSDKFRPSRELGGPKHEFGPPRGQGNFGPQGRGDFEHNKEDRMVDQPGQSREVSTNIEPSHGLDNRGKDRSNIDQTQSGNNALQKDEKLQPDLPPPSSEILPLERPPWMDAQFPEKVLSDNVDGPKPDASFPNSSSQNDPENSGKAINMELEESDDIMELSVFDKNGREISKNPNEQTIENEKPSKPLQQSDRGGKDQNTLPFMGENDPKPEDLNMEPPPELPNLGPITETPNLPAFRSNIQDSERPPRLVTQRGPNSPYFDASGPPSGPFRPGGPMDQFGPRGPGGNRFDLRPPADRQFGPRGPNFGQRGPNDTQFGPRGLNEGHFGPRGPPPFDAKGMHDNHMNMMNQRPPNDGLLGSRPGEEHFGPMGRGFPAPTGPIGNQFGPRPMNNPPFLQRGPNDGQFRPRGPNESMFGPRGPNAGQKSSIPSLLGLQFDKQPNFAPSNPPGSALNKPNTDFMASGTSLEENKTMEGRRSFGVNEPDQNLPFKMDQRPPFGPGPPFPPGRLPGSEQRPPFAPGGVGQRSPFERDAPLDAGQRPPFPQGGPLSEQRPLNRPGGPPVISPHSQGGPEQRPPFIQGGPRGLEENSNPSMGSGGLAGFETRMDQRAPFMPGRQGNSDQNMGRGRGQRMGLDDNFRGNDGRSPFSEPRKGMNDPLPGPNDDSGFYNRSQDSGDRRRMQRDSAVDEFRVGKQFNYNHGGSAMDKKISEVIPGKVIDYGHMTKVIVHEYITPAQCFDYGHGNLKPEVPEHEVVPQRDFRHWEETEQSLKEYDDRLRLFATEHEWQSRPKLRDNFKFERPESREREHSRTERRSFESDDRRLMDKDNRAKRDKDHKEERKDRERDRERDREYARESDREDRSWKDGNDQKERNRDRNERSERSDRMITDQNKEHNKDDDRSKGNVSRQEYQNKSNANTSSLETSTTEAKNETSATAPKKMELPRLPNYTMVDDIIFQPGRQTRPPKIVIILRGPPGSGKSFVAKLIKDKEVEQGGSAPRILSLDDYFLAEKEKETKDDNGKKVVTKEMVYEYEEAMEQSYLTSLVKAFKKNITDGYFNFIILDCINEKIADYEEMWSFAKTKGFQVYVCEMEMDVHICMKRNIHNRTEDEINKIVDYFEPTPNHHLKLDVNAMLQEEAIDEVHMEDSQTVPEEAAVQANDDSQDSQDDKVGVSKWEKMDADNKLDRLDGLAKKKTENRPQTMEDFLQVPDYYNMEDTPGKKRVRWADLEERKEQEKLRAVGFVVGHTNWDRMMDPTKGQSALTRTKYI